MGLFGGSKKSGEEMLDDLANNRGFTSKVANAFMGSDAQSRIQQANAQVQQAGAAAQAVSAGLPREVATVVSLQDTGQTINDNPSVVLGVELDGQVQSLVTLVSRLQIPRVGDRVYIMRQPQTGALLFGGIAPAEQ